MNERITLLALKASDPETGWLDREKFAELIVKECLSVLHKTAVESTLKDEWDKTWQSGVVSGFELVEEHFGVKYELE